MSGMVWFDPTSDSLSLSDGEHYLEIPHWAREILRDEFERETRQLQAEADKLRELATGLHKCWLNEGCESCPMQDDDGWCVRDIRLRELGMEVVR